MQDVGTGNEALDEVIAHFREDARDNRDLGDLFERLFANYLVTDPKYAELFGDVWLWSEWPDRWGPDTGIDLVARERASGEYWAIQCKFYLPENYIQKPDIDSFLSASGKRFSTRTGEHTFAQRLIVSTTQRWGSNAEDAIDQQQPPVIRMFLNELAESPVDWSQFDLRRPDRMRLKLGKTLRAHQEEALDECRKGFAERDRGKLIMACGTGKTFTALRIAEDIVPSGGRILFLAPSISLVSQTLREWTTDRERPFHSLVVCSDTQASRVQEDMRQHDLVYPATTDAHLLAKRAEYHRRQDADKPTVVFSTYQSIQVISDAQKQGFGDFDLVICDEAHRTTGLTREQDDASDFVKVHDNSRVKAEKRLYMTATPRIFAEASKDKAQDKNALLYSMDDEATYGTVFYRLGFGQAVRKELLSDYRVLLVAVNEDRMPNLANAYMAELDADDKPPKAIDSRFVAKILGTWKGLSKKDVRLIGDDGEEDAPEVDRKPMQRAVAFSRSIDASKTLSQALPGLLRMLRRGQSPSDQHLDCAVEHVDGTMNMRVRQNALDWLKAENADASTCRILSNARCLSEGIDVPALDGVIFFDTRESVVDIVQSVGRVMRKAPGKDYGYIILPVGIPAKKLANYDSYVNSDPEFKGIWKVIKALRAHDESLVDEAEFRNKIQVINPDGPSDPNNKGGEQFELELPPLPIGDISEAVYAAIPKKLGDRDYWHDWAKDVARIAQNVMNRITALIEQPGPRESFDEFLASLRKNINPSVSESDAVEMLAQHQITRPVFEALFPDHSLLKSNPVSRSMEDIIEHMDRHQVDSETGSLDRFYESIRDRAGLAKSEKSRQDLIRSLYDSFFATAFESVAKKLGIVYTPVEVVDFILRSADEALHSHFGMHLSDKDVHVLDPFTGTGTFITRLLQDESLIKSDDLVRKYGTELHANEIVLLAYYVATVNIESAFRARCENPKSSSGFAGMVLTDTFQMLEEQDLVDQAMLAENNERVEAQRKLPIKVIVGNPPYSVTQGGAKYPRLDNTIGDTYARYSDATLKNSLYDSYIRAIRWATDRLGDSPGVIAYVTNGGWIDGDATSGLRKCLRDEFSDVYVLNLRGNQRTSGELSRQEGGKIFGGGSRAPVAVTLLVRKPDYAGPATIHYHDIGDYLSREEKLNRIEGFGDISQLPWDTIVPNASHDWLNQRSDHFQELKALTDEKGAIFSLRSSGVKTNRDIWVYNASKGSLAQQVRRHIDFFESETERLAPDLGLIVSQKEREEYVKKNVRHDETRGKWIRDLYQDAARQRYEPFREEWLVPALYRPYVKRWLYNSRMLINTRYQIPTLFPNAQAENLLIQVTGTNETKSFSCLMTNCVPDLHVISGGQCFPLYYYDTQAGDGSPSDNDTNKDAAGFTRRDAITDQALADFASHYERQDIAKEDIFYAVYAVLHSADYRQRYSNDLKKELPRIPFPPDISAFIQAGRDLAHWHLNYESAEPFPLNEQITTTDYRGDDSHLVVKKMQFAGKSRTPDRSRIVVNDQLTLSGIPDEAHEYIVNGKSALEWVMERFQYSRDDTTGIVNDPNEWSDDPRYIVDLVKRVVRVSVETMQIVNSLPPVESKTAADEQSGN